MSNRTRICITNNHFRMRGVGWLKVMNRMKLV